LISQLPPPLILIGDFNAKNILWGAAITGERGRLISDVCAGFDLIILSSGARTHLCVMSGTSSALDLTFCSLGIAVHLEWSILADLHGSDHYALNLHTATRFPILSGHPNCIIRHAAWESFSQSVTLEDREFPSVDFMVEHFTSAVLQAASFIFHYHLADLAGYQFHGGPTSVELPSVPGRERSDTFKPTSHWRISLHLKAFVQGLSVLCARLNALLGKISSPAFPSRRVRMLCGQITVHVRKMQSNIHSWYLFWRHSSCCAKRHS
jgi:hypothetical protein